MLFISHNLGIIAKMCDRVGVLYAGRLVEEGRPTTVLDDPRHPYTVGLLRCVPRGGVRKDHGRLDTIPGFMPNVGEELPGCVFADRCTLAEDRCRTEEPSSIDVGGGHMSRCHFHERAQTLPREMAADLALPAVDRAATPLLASTTSARCSSQQGHDVHALVAVSAAIWPGETLGLVGESGSGKTTLARHAARARRRRRRARSTLDGRELRATLGSGRARGHAGAADRLPEPRLGAQPAALGAPDHAPLAEEARGDHRRRRPSADARADELGAARRALR